MELWVITGHDERPLRLMFHGVPMLIATMLELFPENQPGVLRLNTPLAGATCDRVTWKPARD